ncbi:unnamed protein product [Rotaria magnacalcarata]|uniref:Uncharacterized protein n=7 Tax=Rotaria magnacalcarata TaxID=392030 RepID=A0A816VD88_9BILA|nr:unnamed protein product [Rotaria magnacalcarata]CAF2032882.1 unnamed protein product [Rotaria magnacalcarata]CAF2118624.1 unnamed protein product [Rotaria magnacalcarata]CAF2142706.1 unnamed protein product [Rotaria magnacalcarata]CAF3742400.1 unnamed protein product [Rotaria magnacalcarata]
MASSKQRSMRLPRFKLWHPILPAFSARLIIAFRTLLGITCVAGFTLSPITSQLIQGQLLLGISFIVAIKSTLGATIQTAVRLFIAGAISTAYCLLIINFCPRQVSVGIGATNILVLLIVYTDLPVTVRRFSIVPTCIILLQWITKSHINTYFVLQVWLSLTAGAALAVIVTSIPLPVIPTAYRELAMRMRFITRQARREITAIVLFISEYHNIHLNEGYDGTTNQNRLNTSNSDDNNDGGIEMPSNSYREDDLYRCSASLEDLKDDHLLKSDIQDLHALVNEELKQMQRAMTEIAYEPYFIFLTLLNFTRGFLRHVPFIKKFIKTKSTLETRLSIWTTSLAAIQRTITGLLTLDHHHRAFVGQRQLINAICLLLDSTFNFLDSTIRYTTSSTRYFNTAQTIACRVKVEEALEDFFETYTQVRENPRHAKISNTDAIHLNTFLLLILRLVHVTITAAETSKTPGARLDAGTDSTTNVQKSKKLFNWKKPFYDLAAYIGIRPSSGKLVRAVKTSLSVLISAVVVFTYRKRLQAYGWVYWAPMTTALVSDSSEGGTLRLSFQRLMAVLLGSTYAYVSVLVTQNHVGVGICICLFVGLMGYLKTDPRKEYFASVCAQSASIITFLSNHQGQMGESNKAVLARTSLTFLGIFIHVLISNILLPITARALIKKKVCLMIKNVSGSLQASCDDFCTFIGPSVTPQPNTSSKQASFNLMKTLGETESIADSFPALLDEAINEPNFWKRPFVQVKDRYNDVAKSLRRISANIRFVHRCTTILEAESKLHFAQEAKWQMRRTSIAQVSTGGDSKPSHSWTTTDLRKERQLQNDLDIPLTIFMNYSTSSTTRFEQKTLVSNNSSASLRLAHTTLYQPVLEHIRTLENQIQRVLSLTEQLIKTQAAVDVGSFELQQLCREDSYDEQQIKLLKTQRRLNRGPSFYVPPQSEALPMVANHYKFLSCCRSSQEVHEPLPSLRNAVDLMFTSLIQFLHANNRFIRTEFVSSQSIGDVLTFHTLSYALRDMVEATTDLAKNARRIKHIDTRTLIRTEREEKLPSP